MTSLIHPIAVADYRAAEGVPQSLLKHMADSPAHFAYHRDHPMVATPAMEFGSLCDSLLFGTDFPYVQSPYSDFKTKEAREWRDQNRSDGFAIFKPEDLAGAKELIANVRSRRAVQEIMERGRAQVAMFAEIGGTACKGLADWISESFACIVDLKTTGGSAAPAEWGKTVVNFGYDIQAALYTDMHRACTGLDFDFAWIVAETEPPFEVKVWVAPPEAIERGRRIYTRWLSEYAECVRTGLWPGYPDVAERVTLPRWAMMEGVE